MYSYQPTTFDLTSQLSTPSAEFDRCLNHIQRNDSIDYSRRPSYFAGLLGNPQSEASYSDHEQQTPSPFNGYEDYQQQQTHPLDNNKRRLSTMELNQMYYNMDYNVVNPWLTANTTQSPMMYAHPSVDMYSQAYQQGNYHPLCVSEGIYRERATSSSSSSSDSSSPLSPPSSRRSSTKPTQVKSTLKGARSRGRRVSNSPSVAGQKMFTCTHDDCGKIFKRSEHLKRHIRSIHTLEKRK